MLNYLWAGMTLTGILWGALHGQMTAVTDGAIQASKEAVTLCITMLGVMTLWTGVLEIGHRSGLVDQLARRMGPVLTFLFPRLDPDGEARKQISVNMIANILGLGWAATPAGLKAMEELKKGIQLRAYAQTNPVDAYKKEGFEMFEAMIQAIQEETIRRIILARVQTNEVRRERVAKVTGESGGSEEPQKKAPVRKSIKIGPNDPCPCGSGKKYKKCCYLKDKAAQ